jgi:hypothetical protein
MVRAFLFLMLPDCEVKENPVTQRFTKETQRTTEVLHFFVPFVSS